MDWAREIASRDEKHLGFEIVCALYKMFYGIYKNGPVGERDLDVVILYPKQYEIHPMISP